MAAEPTRAEIEGIAESDPKGACGAARQLVAARPFDEDAARLLTEMVARLQRDMSPRPSYEAALPPPLAEASRLLSAEQDEPAELILRRYLAEHRDDVRAMAMMAEIAGRCDFHDKARKILMRALEIDPRSIDALLGLAKLLNHLAYLEEGGDRGEQALEVLERALAIDPANADVVSLYSSILVRFRRAKEAIGWYDRLLDLEPLHWMAWSNYGMLLNSLGDFGGAVAALRTAAAITPQFGSAWWEIANLKISKLFADDIDRMQAALAEPELDAQARAHIHFTLAKAFDQAKQFAVAADHLEKGNALKREIQPYDPETVRSDVDNSERVFTASFFGDRGARGDPSGDPVFIIGMHRAGTTLVEQILASHSQVEGTEELFCILQLGTEISQRNPAVSWQTGLERASAPELRDLGEAFMRLSRQFRLSDRPWFIDKNPANWRFAGLIATILPNAKIVDVRRNPMDCCYANYSQHYENGVGYSYSQTGLGRYYSDYVRLMRHFDRVAPGRIHHLIYDDLVDDLEASVRALLDYLGLPFEEACLRFFETDRAVLTPSAQQVRQPINRSGFGRWHNYEPWLGELQVALGGTLRDWRD